MEVDFKMRILLLTLQLAIVMLFMIEGRVTRSEEMPEELPKEELPKEELPEEELPEEMRPFIQRIRLRPTVRIAQTQKYPRNLEEAKRWVKEASYLLYEAVVAQKMGKPKSVWQAYYQEAARLAKGVFEKFGNFRVIWLIPENEWGEFGDIVLYPEQIRKDYEEILKRKMPPADPCIFYGEGLMSKALQAAKQKGKKFTYAPEPAYSSPLAVLQYSLYHLGRWKEAMEAIEQYMDSLPWFTDRAFDRWTECVIKVYGEEKLPTKFLLIQSQGPSAYSYPLNVKGKPIRLHFKNGYHFVPLYQLTLNLDWEVKRKNKEIFILAEDKKVRLILNSKVSYVNGYKILLPVAIHPQGNDILVPLQFVSLIARARLKREKGFIRMLIFEFE